MSEQKKSALKQIIINLGVLLVLVGATAVKGDSFTFFITGLILLALQIFDFKGTAPTKIVLAEIILSVMLAVAAITQLIMSRSFNTPQAFLVVLLLGAILIVVESTRKFADLE